MTDYRELPSPRVLAPYVDCFWVRITGDDGTDLRPRIVPDGCIDIVWVGDRESSIVGPATRSALPTLPSHCICIGVRFRPGMAPSLLGIPAHELVNDGGFGLAALAAVSGYADQAHLSREVARLAGVPPAALLSEAYPTASMSDLFKT